MQVLTKNDSLADVVLLGLCLTLARNKVRHCTKVTIMCSKSVSVNNENRSTLISMRVVLFEDYTNTCCAGNNLTHLRDVQYLYLGSFLVNHVSLNLSNANYMLFKDRI